MKGRIFIAVVLIIAAAFVGRMMTRRNSFNGASAREESRQTYALDTGASVEVRGINGSVEINTAETDNADVSITRTADNADDLEGSHVVIEHSPSNLVIRGESSKRNWLQRLWSGGGKVRQQIVLIVPRRIEVETKAVNGPVKIGEVEGSVSVSAVNGRVDVGQASGRSEIKAINGNVKFAMSRLGDDGIEVKGINGNVDVRLKETLNADITVKGLNGNFTLDVPNVTMQERENRANMHARLGAGGPSITITGINGNVRFDSSAPAVPAVPAVPEPPPPPAPPIPPRSEN